MKHPYPTAIPAQPFPSSSPPGAGIQGHKGKKVNVIPAQAGIHTATSRITDKCPPGQARDDTEKGNALFLILIAVALFAALSYAVTTSSNGGGNTSKEQARLGAARILSYASDVRTAVQRMMMLNNVSIQYIRFNNDTSLRLDGTLLEHAMGTPADPALYVFHPRGGMVAPQVFEDLSVPCPGCLEASARAGHPTFRYSELIGSDIADMTLRIDRVQPDVCEAINALAGVPGIPLATVPVYGGSSAPQDSPPPVGMSPLSGAGAAELAGARNFCFESGNTAIFVAVLVAQ